MTDEKFKTEYYEPFKETWKILKLIQYADQTDDYQAQWDRYMKEIDRLNDTYPENRFAQELIRLLVNAGDYIARENQKEHDKG